MNTTYHASVFIGKVTHTALRAVGRSGDSLPGLIANRIYPHLLRDLSKQCSEGVILVCGTNGKTTTCSMIAAILHASGTALIHNRSGSNMTRGHITAFLSKASWRGTVHATLALLEVDEAVLPVTLSTTHPRIVVLHNLFRDQLDRYGEINTIAKKWLSALRSDLPKDSYLIVNADDPQLAYIAKELNHPNTIYYGLNDPTVGSNSATSVVDAYISPASDKPLHYSTYYLSHLGNYRDPGSPFSRPQLTFPTTSVSLGTSEFPTQFTVGPYISLSLPIPGLYNVYNAVAAVVTAHILMVEPKYIQQALAAFVTVFGRFERIPVGLHSLYLCLIKNPAGAGEVIRTLPRDKPISMAFFANDNFADGLDVSWYFDTSFEHIAPQISWSLFSGSRANDMALRLKYAGNSSHPTIIENTNTAITNLLQRVTHEDVYVLSTYTATLNLQSALRKRRLIANYWKEK
jgi:UDP-N-acetylmuramyl tripeptide synthase